MNLRGLKASLAKNNVSDGKSTYLCHFQWTTFVFNMLLLLKKTELACVCSLSALLYIHGDVYFLQYSKSLWERLMASHKNVGNHFHSYLEKTKHLVHLLC